MKQNNFQFRSHSDMMILAQQFGQHIQSTYISIGAMIIWIVDVAAGMIGKCTAARCNQNDRNL